MTALLVSVRNAAEAEEAIAGGAAIIDVKEPSRGALGRADAAVVGQIVAAVAERRAVSVAMGELRERHPGWPPLIDAINPRVMYYKFGLNGLVKAKTWPGMVMFLRHFVDRGARRLVATAYADWQLAKSPSPYDVMEFAIEHRFAAFLIDTWGKDGSTLLDWLDPAELTEMCVKCRAAGVPIALAGSLGPQQIRELLPARPDWFAVRGAACIGGRTGTVDRDRVAALVELISPSMPM